jgi:hypothetical protein
MESFEGKWKADNDKQKMRTLEDTENKEEEIYCPERGTLKPSNLGWTLEAVRKAFTT